MELKLLSVLYRFRHNLNAVEVTLSIESNKYKNFEQGTLVVVVENTNIKDKTLSEIESLAVSRAKSIICQ